MRNLPIGVHLGFREARGMLDRTLAADAAGLDMVWSTVGGAAPDPFVVFGRAAGRRRSASGRASCRPTRGIRW